MLSKFTRSPINFLPRQPPQVLHQLNHSSLLSANHRLKWMTKKSYSYLRGINHSSVLEFTRSRIETQSCLKFIQNITIGKGLITSRPFWRDLFKVCTNCCTTSNILWWTRWTWWNITSNKIYRVTWWPSCRIIIKVQSCVHLVTLSIPCWMSKLVWQKLIPKLRS